MIDQALGKGAKGAIGGGRGRSMAAAGRGRGAKRSSDELDRMAEDFHQFVAKHPGMRIEQINKQLNTTTKDLALPIRKLIADGALKTKGTKRSTTYFAGESKKKKS
jgi:predicted HTH transcriptional regulator